MKTSLKLGLLTLITFTFTACFHSNESTDTPTEDSNTEMTTYQNAELSIAIPRDWEIIEAKDFSDRVAPNTVIAFRNNIKNDIYTASINIVTNERLSDKSSADHGKEIINSEKASVVEYKELSRESISLKNAGNTDAAEFIIFEGKESAEDDLVRYVQTFLAKDDKVYIVTGSYRPTEEERMTQLIQQSVKSFELK